MNHIPEIKTDDKRHYFIQRLGEIKCCRLVMFSVISGFVLAGIPLKGFSESTNVPQFIRIDLDLHVDSYYARRSANQGWVTNAHAWSSSVVIGADTWRIESGMENATGLWFCDSTNCFYTPDIHSNIVDPKSPMILVPHTGRQSVVVVPGINPLGDFRVNLVWLAYCSGNYLRSTNHLLPLPGGEPRQDINLFAVEDRTALSKLPPFLPQKIDFLVNNGNGLKATNSILLFPTTEPRPMPDIGPSGKLMATYQVERFTNYSGWMIPDAFTYVQDSFPTPSGSGRKYSVTGKVTKIAKTTSPEALLEKGVPRYVEDTRFRHPTRMVASMRYWVTNGTLPTSNDPAMLGTMDRLASKRPLIGVRAKSVVPAIRRVYAILIVVLLTMPLIISLRAGRSKGVRS